MVSRARADGPTLLLDAGDALSAEPGLLPPEAVGRSRRILEAMGAMRQDAMAVGPRDLGLGLDALREAAGDAGVPLLSANLRDGDGRPAFPPARKLEVGGRPVGVIGLSTASARGPEATAYARAGLTALDPAEAAVEAARALGPVDLLVVLGRLSGAEAASVAEAVPEARLLLMADHGALTRRGRQAGQALAFEAGVQGKHVLKLDVRLDGPGPLVDEASLESARRSAEALRARVAQVDARLAEATDPGLAGRLEAERARADASLQAQLRRLAEVGGGRVVATAIALDAAVSEDPAIAALVGAAD